MKSFVEIGAVDHDLAVSRVGQSEVPPLCLSLQGGLPCDPGWCKPHKSSLLPLTTWWFVMCSRVVEAPWKEPYAEMGAFFNFGLNPARWRAYAREVHMACAQMRLQEPLHVYNPLLQTGTDPDLPPHLKTALLAKARLLYNPYESLVQPMCVCVRSTDTTRLLFICQHPMLRAFRFCRHPAITVDATRLQFVCQHLCFICQ